MATDSRAAQPTKGSKEQMKTISFQGLIGGSGNTSIVAGVAHALSQLQQKVLVIDLCPSNFLSMQFNLAIDHADGWAHALFTERSIEATCMRYTENIDFIPFGELPNSLEIIGLLKSKPNFFSTLLQKIKSLNLYQWLLLDLPNKNYAWQPQLLSDKTIMTLSPNANCHMRLNKYEHQENTNFLITQYNPSHQLAHDLKLLWLKLHNNFLSIVIHHDSAIGDAQALKMPVTLASPNSAASQDIRSLSYWLMDIRYQ